MSDRAVFLDRDGTINVDYGYVGKTDTFTFLPRVREALVLLQGRGFKLFVISNQSGVNRGYYTHEDLQAVHDKMVSELGRSGVTFSDVFYCVHRPDEKCECRKPSPKAVRDIAARFGIDLRRSYFVGDRETDIQTGKNAGTRTVLLSTGPAAIACDHRAADLYSAAEWIIGDAKV
ncbi:MAG TPA: HAD family hydrolase [bacterium]|nr:HAD family hydrolase [bacterium]